MARALIAMSGGVDSSVAAYLMKEAGFDCAGLTMKLYENEDAGISRAHTCCSLEDVEDARSAAYRLGMKHYVFNFTDDFRRSVMEKFAQCYARGVTPNPCIDCNRYLKFDKLLQRAEVLGYDLLATGHYARIEESGGKYVLKKALDASKDQSYVLYMLTQRQLAHIRFPLGTYLKAQVRWTAVKLDLCNAQKPDSQDICFVPDGDYACAVERISGRIFPPGDFVSADGAVLGRHNGFIRYTIGQRKGLGIASSEPYFVCGIRPADNTVLLGRQNELYRAQADAADFNWISGTVPQSSLRCKVRLRYRQPEQSVTVIPTGEASVHLRFDEPQRAVTPGQAAVLYDGDTVLGGGTII
ncbi:MAG: tRNA 2-thiouridine(34) synthase MnmA [Clostridia bacterium]|nr:tRNA 2-thiouridine(34) synthase MnmA [Clostridia bacterium]